MTGLEETNLGGSGIVRRGMGIICEARQVPLNREIALKVLASSPELTSRSVLRFQREAAAATNLHHTNTVSVCATGKHQGTHFYAMERRAVDANRRARGTV